MGTKNILARLIKYSWRPEVFFALTLILLLLAIYFIFPTSVLIQTQIPQAIIDVAIFGVLIVIFNRIRERRLDIKRWQEEIDDYMGWKEPEATH